MGIEGGIEKFEYADEKERERKTAEERLKKVMDKKVSGVSVDNLGGVEIKFKDGSTFRVNSWDALDDKPNFEGIEVSIPEKSKEDVE